VVHDHPDALRLNTLDEELPGIYQGYNSLKATGGSPSIQIHDDPGPYGTSILMDEENRILDHRSRECPRRNKAMA
jgi:hypothetical protein